MTNGYIEFEPNTIDAKICPGEKLLCGANYKLITCRVSL